MRTTDEILTLEEAEQFVSACGAKEEAFLLTALLKSLSLAAAIEAANEAGYDLELQ